MEVHGYTEDGSIEVTIDGVRWTVPDDMSSPKRRQVAEWEELGNAIPPYEPPPPAPYVLYKSTFIRRMSVQEAETMEGVLAAADAKLRLLFNSVEYFVSDDPLFADLRAAVATALGQQRADDLLAPETV